jgi:asparagine synthase (glutamine-hydrolysing)
MCGIAGMVNGNTAAPADRPRLECMGRALAHRGPDDEGFYLSGPVGLAHRRLSIVDLKDGHQPISNEDGSLWLVFNGEIYNHRALRAWLKGRGHCYRTRSDTETILHLYEEYGPRAVEELWGMFAFAIWDERKRELFMARDRLGVKPLYYVHAENGSFYFASEIKALLAAGAVKPELNHEALPDYLANRATSGEETLFRGVRRLLPGHTLRLRDGEIERQRYWDVPHPDASAERPRSAAAAIEQWQDLFQNSVRLRLMADVPLGLFLSGGIDSSAIGAVMSRMVDAPVKSFSVGFAEREGNELAYARLIARTFRMEHHEILLRPEEFFEALPRLVWHEDEPLAGAASVPLYFVSRLAAESVKVVLTGEGSDEVLAGYGRYWKTIANRALADRYHAWAPDRLRGAVRRSVESLPPGSTLRHKLQRTFLCLDPDIESLYFENFAVFPSALQHALLARETKERIGRLCPYAEVRRYFDAAEVGTLLDRLLYADVKTSLHELLMKQDQMSMAASIESRVPFLDHRLVEFSAGLPESMKLRRGTTKVILRQGMSGTLPRPILKRRKMGFPVPLARWFRGPFRWVVDEYILSERASGRGLFDKTVLQKLAGEHLAGLCDHSDRLWTLANFEIWQRVFLDGEAPSRAA